MGVSRGRGRRGSREEGGRMKTKTHKRCSVRTVRNCEKRKREKKRKRERKRKRKKRMGIHTHCTL